MPDGTVYDREPHKSVSNPVEVANYRREHRISNPHPFAAWLVQQVRKHAASLMTAADLGGGSALKMRCLTKTRPKQRGRRAARARALRACALKGIGVRSERPGLEGHTA